MREPSLFEALANAHAPPGADATVLLAMARVAAAGWLQGQECALPDVNTLGELITVASDDHAAIVLRENKFKHLYAARRLRNYLLCGMDAEQALAARKDEMVTTSITAERIQAASISVGKIEISGAGNIYLPFRGLEA